MLQQKSAIKFIKTVISLAIIAQFAPVISDAGENEAQPYTMDQIHRSIFKVSDCCGYGDGVLFDDSGLILTLREFAIKPKSIRVWIDDSTKVEGRLIASDYKSNLAVVKIHPELTQELPSPEIYLQTSTLSDTDTLYIFNRLQGVAIDTLTFLRVSDSLLFSPQYLDRDIKGKPIFDTNLNLISIATGISKSADSDSLFISFADQQSIMRIIDKSRKSARARILPSPEIMPLLGGEA